MSIPSTARTALVSGVAGNIAFYGPTRVQTGVLDTTSAANNVWGRAFTVKSSANETVQAGGTGAFAGIMISPKTYAIDTAYAANNTVAEFLTMGEVFVDLDAAAAPVEGGKVYFIQASGLITHASGAGNTEMTGAVFARHAVSTESGKKVAVVSLTGPLPAA